MKQLKVFPGHRAPNYLLSLVIVLFFLSLTAVWTTACTKQSEGNSDKKHKSKAATETTQKDKITSEASSLLDSDSDEEDKGHKKTAEDADNAVDADDAKADDSDDDFDDEEDYEDIEPVEGYDTNIDKEDQDKAKDKGKNKDKQQMPKREDLEAFIGEINDCLSTIAGKVDKAEEATMDGDLEMANGFNPYHLVLDERFSCMKDLQGYITQLYHPGV